MMVMVKAFGYGNGGLEIANYSNITRLITWCGFADEGIALKKVELRYLLWYLIQKHKFFSYNSTPIRTRNLQSKRIYAFENSKQKNLYHFPIHIKFDTGMHRLGFEENTIDELPAERKYNSSHKKYFISLATSDDLEHMDFANTQIALFEKLSTKLILN
jgi:alanine racemase